MNRPTFNVLAEPWIPVIRLDGKRENLGILPCLGQAHEIREIRDPSPIIEFGLYRLLVAFVLDALVMADKRPEDPIDLNELIAAGKFDCDLLGRYANDCGEVFDLFHPDRPFMQSGEASGEEKSVFDPYPLLPTGANVTHFAHGDQDQHGLSNDEAARLLVAISPFNVKVKTGSPRTIVGDPPLYSLPIGHSLFESVVLNLPMPSNQFTDQDERNIGPIWRTPLCAEPIRTTPTQSFTWPCRFVRLVPSDERIQQMHNVKGLKSLRTWVDPSCAVFFGDDKVRHYRLEERLPLWVDAGPLGVMGKGTSRDSRNWKFVRPEVVSTALETLKAPICVIRYYGWRTDQAKVYEWQRSVLHIPVKLALHVRLAAVLMEELGKANSSSGALRDGLRALYPRGAKGKKDPLGCTTSRCERMFWLRLEREFGPLMSRLAELPENAPDTPSMIEGARNPWREAIRKIAEEQFESAAKDMDADSDALERHVRARAMLTKDLRKILE
ncbi:MAG: type I-E CRISPR-associated protein Cse1/CasA [Armatimonadetes bacterium]|nr:type I-E CRISPR-associated protein Cse1/CasA [Armatimonadota bacterium]